VRDFGCSSTETDRILKIKILHIYIEKSCMYIFKFILGLHKMLS